MQYNVIDSDGHILEPPDLWEKYIDPKFRADCPKLFATEDGHEVLRIEGDFALELSRTPAGNTKKKIIKFGGLGAFGARSGAFDGATPAYLEGKKGGFDPHERIKDMDAEGIDASVSVSEPGIVSGWDE